MVTVYFNQVLTWSLQTIHSSPPWMAPLSLCKSFYLCLDSRQLPHPTSLLFRQAVLRGRASSRVQALSTRSKPEQAAATNATATGRCRRNGTSCYPRRRIKWKKKYFFGIYYLNSNELFVEHNTVATWKPDCRVFKWPYSRHNLCP
jgi:hypothetical protein